MSNNHERFEWFAIGFIVCLLSCFYSYVAVERATTGEAQPYVEVCKPTETQDQIRDIRKLLEVK